MVAMGGHDPPAPEYEGVSQMFIKEYLASKLPFNEHNNIIA